MSIPREQHATFRTRAREFLRARRGKLALALLCMIGGAAADLLSPWPLKLIFDQILLGKPAPPAFAALHPLLAGDKAHAVFVVSLGILGIAGLGALFSYLQQSLTASMGYELVAALRCELFAHLQNLSLSFHNRSRTGELLGRVTGETEALKDVFVESVLLAASQGMTILGMFAVMFFLNWKLALVVLATFPALLFALGRIYRQIKLTTRRQREREGRIAARLSEVLSSVRLIKAYGREGYEQERFEEESTHTLTEGVRLERMAAAATEVVEILRAVGLWATILIGAWLVLAGSLTPGGLLIFTAYLNDMYKPLRNLAKTSARFSRAVVSMQRLGEIFDTEPERWNENAPYKADGIRGEIVFENVSFEYGDGREILHDLSFRIAPGEHVALVGPSGAGKSTIVNLILRFYHATRGRIRVDGVDIEEFQRELLRREIGVSLQESLLFGASIRENIAYGKPGAAQADIERAARQAYAHEFIAALPRGYDTLLGERGSTLSGGQRQRLCLARAFLKNPSILILDEPTSSVDDESAALIQKAIEELRRGKTTIVIAHHFPALDRYDQLLCLEAGRLTRHPSGQEEKNGTDGNNGPNGMQKT